MRSISFAYFRDFSTGVNRPDRPHLITDEGGKTERLHMMREGSNA
jgi:hypothetical protein